jgi:hypothetical protein
MGHGLAEVARRLGTRCPVDYQDFASERAELAQLIADHHIPELAQFDTAAAAELLTNWEPDDLALAGYTLDELTDPDPQLIPLEIKSPPTMSWTLIGIPIHEFAALQSLLDALPAHAVIHTTANDENGQP